MTRTNRGFEKIRQALRPDAGLTLVEMLIYLVLASIVLAVGGSVLNAVYQAQTKVTRDTQQSQSLQLAFASLGAAMRNANQVQLGSVSGGYLLVTRIAASSSTYPVGADLCRDWMFYPNAVVSGQPLSYGLYTHDFALNSGMALTATSTAGWSMVAPAVIKDLAADALISAPTNTSVSGGNIYGVTIKYALVGSATLSGAQKFYSRVVPTGSLVGSC